MRSTGSKPFKEGKFTSKSIMKTSIKNTFLLPVLIASLGLLLPGRVPAQTFTPLHVFTTDPYPYTNTDGAHPYDGLILSGNTLYGTASVGGRWGEGTVFAINTNNMVFTNLYDFTITAWNNGETEEVNNDGFVPNGGLILSGGTLYGTAQLGGTNGFGTVFALSTNGQNFITLHPFSNLDGAHPEAGLLLSGSTLYGTAAGGGNGGSGTVFAINTNGMGFTNLYSFSTEATNALGNYTNFDGANPIAGLLISGNTLYGTTYAGGTNGFGTVFSVSIVGTGFTNLHTFTATSGPLSTNSDGATPYARLLLAGSTLYGTASAGGTNGTGALFSISTNGLNFKNLYSFSSSVDYGPNSDGANPLGGLILSSNILYGTARNAGTNGNGTLFAINTNGTGFTTLHNLNASDDGSYPGAGLILISGALYGSAAFGGSGGSGTVFSLSLGSISPPQLTITLSGTNVILTWAAAGYTLQSTTNLAPPAVWDPVSGQNAVTNPISGTRKFYRLSQ
jgi:uncharacterized repeat protein (TIGR03803 family)